MTPEEAWATIASQDGVGIATLHVEAGEVADLTIRFLPSVFTQGDYLLIETTVATFASLPTGRGGVMPATTTAAPA